MHKVLMTLCAGLVTFANGQNCVRNCTLPQVCVTVQGQDTCMMPNTTAGNCSLTCPLPEVCVTVKGQDTCMMPNNTAGNCTLTCPLPEICVTVQGQDTCMMPNNTVGNCSLTCPLPEVCVTVQGQDTCMMPNNTNGGSVDCSQITCPTDPPSDCSMQTGSAVCVPRNMTKDCTTTPCQMGTTCVMMGGMPYCQPDTMSDCKNMTCPPGEGCIMAGGMPTCMTQNATDCSQITCGPGEKCMVMMGMAMCAPANVTAGCGNGVECKPGTKCDTSMGMGICVPNNVTMCSDTSPCTSGQKCMPVPGMTMSVCVPENVTIDCAALQCESNGLECEVNAGMPTCVPKSCRSTQCSGFMKCEMVGSMPKCLPVIEPSCDSFQCGGGMTCKMSTNGPMCEPNQSGMCGGVGGVPCPADFECQMPSCPSGTDCPGVCVPKKLNEGDVCMSQSAMKDNSFFCKAGTSCRESAVAGEFTCQPTTDVRCTVDSCASNQMCTLVGNQVKCKDIQKDPCDTCKADEVCSIDKTAGSVTCTKLNPCQELRHLQGKPSCVSDSLCEIVANDATCKNGQPPTEDKCAGKAASSPDADVAYCSSSGKCPPGFSCTGCASNCMCDIFTGNEICNRVMCRPVCEMSPVAIPCMELVNRNMTADEREYCCREEKIGCEVYNCMMPSPVTSPSQKEFCCRSFPNGRWCGNNTAGWDCLSEPSTWPYDQRKYCCESEQVGCPVAKYDCSVSAGSVSFVDNGGYTIAMEDTMNWSPDQKTYCCDKWNVGCTDTDDNVNCDKPENAPIWSANKRRTCCRKNHTACEPKTDMTDSYMDLLKKCQAATISEEQRTKCCEVGLRCGAAVHNCYDGTEWNTTKRDWCCTRENCGCSVDCKMDTTDAAQKTQCCDLKGLQCTPAQQPKKDRTAKPGQGKKDFKLAFKGSKEEIELNPKQFLRGIRKAIISTSKALLENPKALRISFVGWLKAGTNTFPSEDEIDEWGFPVPDPWNDENTAEENSLKDVVQTTFRGAAILGTVQSVGDEGVFVEATTDDGIVTEIETAITSKDPTLMSNADGNKYLIEPVGDEIVVEGSTQPTTSDDDDGGSKWWIALLVVVPILGMCAAFAVYKKKQAEPKETGLGNFGDFTREQELKHTMVEGSI